MQLVHKGARIDNGWVLRMIHRATDVGTIQSTLTRMLKLKKYKIILADKVKHSFFIISDV
jgi:hypothetical protein